MKVGFKLDKSKVAKSKRVAEKLKERSSQDVSQEDKEVLAFISKGSLSQSATEQAKEQMVIPVQDSKWSISSAVNAPKDGDAGRQLGKDLESLPAEPSYTSDTYQRVPIEEFGKAMLRGMGVKEELLRGGKDVQDQPRPARLGLGAKLNPLQAKKEAERREKRRRRAIDAGASEKEAEKKRKEKFKELTPGKIIRMSAGQLQGRCGVIVQTENVPGLERMLVRIGPEDKEGRVSVRKRDAVVLVASDLQGETEREVQALIEAESKYRKKIQAEQKKQQEEEAKRQQALADELAVKKEEGEGEAGDKRENSKHRSKSKGRSEKDSQSRDDDRGSSKRQRIDTTPNWLLPGIRVKVVSKSFESGRYYKRKGVVVDVVAPKVATLRMDTREGDIGRGTLLENVAQKVLETVIPSRGDKVLVLAGEHKGEKGVIVEKRNDKEEAMVRLEEEIALIPVHYDHISQILG